MIIKLIGATNIVISPTCYKGDTPTLSMFLECAAVIKRSDGEVFHIAHIV